ncbi:CDP-alcohol phosphatidyltransferase family protein [Luedemannella flava]|uniref:Phosphatidylinositol phosphate synthase n=1 Tax=Luedemannella flava TaxID=349316 RepID=A0ABN2MAM1_9ACTN
MAKILTTFKNGTRAAFDPVGRVLIRAGISPDAVTVFGTVGVVAVSVIFAGRGQLLIATLAITAFALLDVVDGAMARARGHSTKFGGVLDSTMDRVADGAVFGALAWWLGSTGQGVLAGVTIFCLVGGQVVSYVKARAEGAGLRCDVGIAERLERLALLGVGGLLHGAGVTWGLGAALWLLAVLTLITIVQRLLFVREQDRTAVAP